MIDKVQAVAALQTSRDFIRFCYSQMMEQQVFLGHGHVAPIDEAKQLVLAALYLPWDADDVILDGQLLEGEKGRIVDFIQRRIVDREPLPYIINEAWFMQLPFYVDTRVLIPRSPIAQLIEHEFSPFLAASPVNSILDMCTGSGCIGIACGYVFDQAQVDLADISEDAIAVATINVEKHQMQDQVKVIQSDLFENISKRYDIIVSNPPYVDKQDLATMPDEYQHEPALALGSGDDGLDLCKQILAQASDYLTEQGLLVVEVGNSEVHLMEQFAQVPFIWVELANGGNGVFVINNADLVNHRHLFEKS